ncbi:DNA-binding transcriptional regulator, MarR family [Oceanobacillus limi]|uniref:DNA-binding transcriptional regulator, MarR family n=1 Tax=Oceanobacillus limi TaxID=930131 RepID=A0A1I0CES7_9BACI|nr:MarR family transcriptional regulator [Oceanobacillus limi]SET17610.1 DNA-binding transcriptional regulator, MarR family [Oceanobacillus limi]
MSDQDFFHLLNQKVRFINKQLNDCLSQYGLYKSQWSVLFLLNKEGAMTQTEITHYFHVEAPTVTRTLKRMEANNWVKRVQGNDKRERLIDLTEMAKQRYGEIEKAISEQERKMVANLSNTEKQKLYNLLQKLG